MPITIAQGPGALSEYYDWFDQALPGEVAIYWIGDLQFDRDLTNFPEAKDNGDLTVRIKSLDTLARRVFDDAREGHLTLTQKKLNTSQYEYWAIMKRKPDGHSRRNSKNRMRKGSLADA